MKIIFCNISLSLKLYFDCILFKLRQTINDLLLVHHNLIYASVYIRLTFQNSSTIKKTQEFFEPVENDWDEFRETTEFSFLRQNCHLRVKIRVGSYINSIFYSKYLGIHTTYDFRDFFLKRPLGSSALKLAFFNKNSNHK